jgi:hypothetical protein
MLKDKDEFNMQNPFYPFNLKISLYRIKYKNLILNPKKPHTI